MLQFQNLNRALSISTIDLGQVASEVVQIDSCDWPWRHLIEHITNWFTFICTIGSKYLTFKICYDFHHDNDRKLMY